MSVRIASTCLPSTKARYSAAVSAKRGVSRRCVDESEARLRKSAVRGSAPLCSRLRRKYSALSHGTPIPAKTIAKSPPAPLPRSRAWLAISTAIRSCGRPPPEKIGSFCPRTRLFMRSSVVIPVSMKSRGLARATGLSGSPSIGCRVCAATGGPPSITWPTPLNTRPRMPPDRPNDSGSPTKRTTVSESARPDVDSRTSIVASSSSSAAMRPSRARPSVPRTSTASPRPASTVRRRKRSGPTRRAAARSTVSRIDAFLGSRELCEFALDDGQQRVEARELVVADLLAHPLHLAHAGQARDGVGVDAFGERALGEVDEAVDKPHHRGLARRRADAVDLGQRGLPEERLVDDARAEQRELLPERQRVLADDPRHPLEPRLLVEQREAPPPLLEPAAVAGFGPPRRERRGVLGVGEQRMDRGIEARLRALDVERPERLHVALRVRGDRLREVARRGADRADHGDRADPARERLHQRRALVEVGDPRREVRRIAPFARQLAEPSRDL